MTILDKEKEGKDLNIIIIDSFKELLKDKADSFIKDIYISFSELSKFDPDLAEQLIIRPEETMELAQAALHDMGYGQAVIRFNNLFENDVLMPFQVNAEKANKFVGLKGIIHKSSGITQDCKSAEFQCRQCGNVIRVIMRDNEYREPQKCSCACKRFSRVSMHVEDVIKIGIIDDLLSRENKDRTKAEEKICILEKGLATVDFEKKLKLGKTVIMNGYLKFKLKNKEKTELEMKMIVNSVDFIQTGWNNVVITPEEEKQIINLSKEKDIIDRLSESIADVEGFQTAKKALILLLAGSPFLYDKNLHLQSRGTIHVLLIGDPGNAKSYLASRAAKISPIYMEGSANNASGKGLIAAVSQSVDKDIGAWALYPGIVPMATGGIAYIDEIDKTHPEDYGDHNSAMNDCEVKIAKATVKARLETKTSYIATANPENREWVPGQPLSRQISMPKDFLDRFDLIVPFKSSKESVHKDKVMDIMLSRHSSQERKWNPEFTHEFITKYIAYCRREKESPNVSNALFPYIKEKLHELMRPAEGQETRISFRHIESIMRFAYASARLKMRDMSKEDVDTALDLKRRTFIDLEIIDEKGVYNWAKAEDIDVVKISDKKIFLEIMDLFPEDAMIPVGDIINKCREKGLPDYRADEFLEKAKREGEYFEPKLGFFKRLK